MREEHCLTLARLWLGKTEWLVVGVPLTRIAGSADDGSQQKTGCGEVLPTLNGGKRCGVPGFLGLVCLCTLLRVWFGYSSWASVFSSAQWTGINKRCCAVAFIIDPPSQVIFLTYFRSLVLFRV